MERLVDIQKVLVTAGGKVVCARCTAKSKRTGQQCGRPALKTSRTSKCALHGGRGNSGPKTPEGKARAIAAHTKTGEYSNAAREAHARASARLLRLEDAAIVLGLITDTRRSPGRKPRFYEPIVDVAGVLQMALDDVLYRVGGSDGG